MRIFVINLPTSVDRRHAIMTQAAQLGLEIEILDAINGKDLTEKQINELTKSHKDSGMTLGEVGCSLSHLSVYQKIADENIPLALIMEDDAEISNNIKTIADKIKKINNPDKPNVFLLSKVNQYIDTGKKEIFPKYSLVKVLDADFSHGYILNTFAARNLINYLQPVWLEADKWRFLIERNIVNVRAIIPPIINTSELALQSSLEDERKNQVARRIEIYDQLKKERSLKVKLRLMIWRIFIRSWVKIVKQ